VLSSGVDRLGATSLWSDDRVQITTAGGVASSAIANHAIALILHRLLGLGSVLTTTRNGGWYELSRPARQVSGQTLGIIGLGSIGSRIAAIAEQLGFHLISVERSTPSGPPRYRLPWVVDLEEGHRPNVTYFSLNDVLARSDVLVLAAPATNETRHLISAEALAKVKPGVIIVNVARGSLIDEAALIAAVEQGTVGGACLDVTNDEPPPFGSPLRSLENVDLTPHMAGWFEGYYDEALGLVTTNIARYREGLPLLNVIRPVDTR
jgi:D-3-phosphoglycerate dehydrogenase